MIVDAHAHVTPGLCGFHGTGRTRSLPWGQAMMGTRVVRVVPPLDPEPLRFLPESLLAMMDEAGVERAVLLQGPFYGDHNQFLHQAVTRWPERFVPAAYVDPWSPEGSAQFTQAVDQFGFRIVKLEMSEATGLVGIHPDARLNDERGQWIAAACAERGLVLTLDLGAVGSLSYQTAAVDELARRHPDLKIVIAHLAQPPLADHGDAEQQRAWEEQIALGRHEHVWFDTSALPACGGQEYPFPRAVETIRRAYELIGAEKLLWGTDAPGLLAQATYQQLLDMVRRHCAFFTPAELTAVLGGNAARVYLPP